MTEEKKKRSEGGRQGGECSGAWMARSRVFAYLGEKCPNWDASAQAPDFYVGKIMLSSSK